MNKIRSSEITPEHLYMTRRRFLGGAAKLVAGTALLAACGVPATPNPPPNSELLDQTREAPAPGATEATATPTIAAKPTFMPTPSAEILESFAGRTDELGYPITSFEAVSSFNNYYEFSTSKDTVAKLARYLEVSPWTVEVGGLVNRPRRFGIEDLLKFEQEERIYRMRCVEGWSMVIPWLGFPLSRLLKEVEPLSSAKYVRFETAVDKKNMPGTYSKFFPWPYVEGLRIDEAMHDLTILSTGLYGYQLLPQNGAPIRLVVPWKYGFKSLKSIVRIELVEDMPFTFWMEAGAGEYGFWANVNPEVPHARWSQATERFIGEDDRRPTLFFNGYADEVASLYPNLDSQDLYY